MRGWACIDDERNVPVEFVQDMLRRCRTDSTEAIGAGRSERFSECANDFDEGWMRTDSNCDCVQTRRHDFRNNLSFWQNHCEWAGPEFFAELENQFSIRRRKRGDFSSRVANGESAHRNSARHLRGRQKRIEPLKF